MKKNIMLCFYKLNKNQYLNITKTISTVFLLTIVFLLFIILNIYLLIDINLRNFFVLKKIYNISTNLNEKNYCTFKHYNIWNKEIFDYIRPKIHFNECNITYKNDYYNLKEGVLSLKRKDVTCYYSCKYPKNHLEIINGPYIKINKPVVLDCDVFHIKCFSNTNLIIFEDVAFHIKKIQNNSINKIDFLDSSFKISKNFKFYDINLYIIDSLSYYHSKRALQKTRNYLLKNLNGIEMKFLNSVGGDSRSNAYAFLLNKQINDVIDIFGKNRIIKNDYENLNSCDIPLDNTTFIQEYFKKMGYMTLIGEDFMQGGIFNWPYCIGFEKPPVHHSLSALQVILERSDLKGLTKKIFRERCYSKGFFIQEYMDDFLQKYKNKLKFSILWHSYILHDELNSIFAGDDLLYDYFQRNEAYFNNSFNILMGDHGFKMSYFVGTNIGSFEYMNPYFILTIPNELKSNKKLLKNLNENSNKHISHFDIYATLIDLLTIASKDNFKNLDKQENFPIINNKIKGLSLLRPLPEYNRTCYEMRIPPQYCLCKVNIKKPTTSFNKERSKLAKGFIKALNNKLIVGNLTDKCSPMKLDETEEFKVEIIETNEFDFIYKINAITLPGQARYLALMNKNFEVINDEIIRTNIYKDQAEVCEKKSLYRMYCYCKILVKNEKK